MAAIMLQTIPSFYAKNSEKSLFISATTYEKNIACKDYCIAQHHDKTCFLPACKYHIILLGENEELLYKLDTFCSNFQHVDCLYTLFKYRFNGKNFAKSWSVFDNVQRAISFTQRNRGVDKIPSIAKKRFLRKKFKQHFMSAPQKNISTQTSGSVFAERIEKAKETKLALELIKNVDCFLDDHGIYDSKVVSFEIKSLEQTKVFVTFIKSNECSQRNKLLLRKETPNQKISTLFRFQNKIFTPCQISNQIFFTTRQFLKQKFHNKSDLKSKNFVLKNFLKKTDFPPKSAVKKSWFDWIFSVKWTKLAISVHS